MSIIHFSRSRHCSKLDVPGHPWAPTLIQRWRSFFSYFDDEILQIRQIFVFLPHASPHESSDFCLSRPQKPPFPSKNAPYSGRFLIVDRSGSSRVYRLHKRPFEPRLSSLRELISIAWVDRTLHVMYNDNRFVF